MRIVPLSEPVFRLFSSWFAPNFVPWPKSAIMISENIEGSELLVGGVCIYETDGPYVLFEHFALNPSLPVTIKHRVAEGIVRAAKTYLATRGKIGFAWVNFEGGQQLFQRFGFIPQRALLMTHIPGTAEPEQPVVRLKTPEPNPSPEEPDEPEDEPEEKLEPEEPDDDMDLGFNKPKKAKKKGRKRRSLAKG